MYTITSSMFRSTIGHLRENNIILTGEITDGFTFSNTRMLKYTALEHFVIKLNHLKFSTMELEINGRYSM
jgi:hypothetical protein